MFSTQRCLNKKIIQGFEHRKVLRGERGRSETESFP